MVRSILKPYFMACAHIFKSCFTVKYPYEVVKPSERYRGRPLLSLEECIGCGVCAWICLNKAIEMVKVGEHKFPQFNLGRCCFCGLCADSCPKLALVMTDNYEISEYDKEGLIYSPERISQPPKPKRGKIVTVKKYSKYLGAAHR